MFGCLYISNDQEPLKRKYSHFKMAAKNKIENPFC